MNKIQVWPKPKYDSVGLFTDLRLYYDALTIGISRGTINAELLSILLPERIIGLKLVAGFKARTFEDLIRELSYFHLIVKVAHSYEVTPEGHKLKNLHEEDQSKYYEVLIRKMNETYVIPGWFVDRLWKLNPEGQGQIVIPTPIKEWKPKSKDNNHFLWNEELDLVTKQTLSTINKKLPRTLPIEIELLRQEIRKEYERQGSDIKARRKTRGSSDASLRTNFSPRKRLTLSMQNVVIKMLFGNNNPKTDQRDFAMKKDPLKSRTFMVWCPRLESLGLVYYTDYNHEIPGRILFPTSVFRSNPDPKFSELNFIRNPQGKSLSIFTPSWNVIRVEFLRTLNEVYQVFYNKDGVIYVSLQDIRDEVCRLLRITSSSFESFIALAFEESVKKKIDFAISLETDIRAHQGGQMLRKPVNINKVQHTLIAIKPFKH